MSILQRLVLILAAVVLFWGGAMAGAFVTKAKYGHDYHIMETEVSAMQGRVEEFVNTPVECATFGVATRDEYGRIYIGEIDLCGRDLQWGNVHGPATESFGGSEPDGVLQ